MTKAKKKEEKVDLKKIPGTSPTLLETEAAVEMKTISDKFKEIGLPPIGDVMALSANGRRLAEVIKEREGIVEKIPKVVVEGKTITEFRKIELDRRGKLNINGQDYRVLHLGFAFGRLSGDPIPADETRTFFLFTLYEGSEKLGYFLMDETSELIIEKFPFGTSPRNQLIPLTVLIGSCAIKGKFSGHNLLINAGVEDCHFKHGVFITGNKDSPCTAKNVILEETFVEGVDFLPPGRYMGSRIIHCTFDVPGPYTHVIDSHIDESNFRGELVHIKNSRLSMSEFVAEGSIRIEDARLIETNADIGADHLHLVNKFCITQIECLSGRLTLATQARDQLILSGLLGEKIVFGIDITREELIELLTGEKSFGKGTITYLLGYVVDTIISRIGVLKLIMDATEIVDEVKPYSPVRRRPVYPRNVW